MNSTPKLVRLSLLGLAFLVAGWSLPVRAGVVLFDFEDQAATFNPPTTRPGDLTSLVLSGSGLTATITRDGGVAFDIVANVDSPVNQVKPVEFGLRSLDPFVEETSDTWFVVDLSADVIAASVDMGDYGGDTDTLILEAYSGQDGTGTLLDSDTLTLVPGNGFTFLTLSVSAATAPIRSLRMVGGSSAFPNSVFYDNLRLTTPVAVPEPATWISGVLAVSLAAGVRARRRRLA